MMAAIAPFSPSLAPNKSEDDEVLILGDPKFALNGELLLLFLVLLFATLFIVLIVFLYGRNHRNQ
ncbi:hypothetical protein RchiOBHm_Chr3g0462331 [Rosa chinensis]|uniref:Uncharacterized protein n=1 Tax=Rosa chinensis TaxID=74649 RepID=A0A2P6R8X6_ROSCH|nr:hypothetical protein RchiOBHm_Chr3g0462331 [Rosa chinensis]